MFSLVFFPCLCLPVFIHLLTFFMLHCLFLSFFFSTWYVFYWSSNFYFDIVNFCSVFFVTIIVSIAYARIGLTVVPVFPLNGPVFRSSCSFFVYSYYFRLLYSCFCYIPVTAHFYSQLVKFVHLFYDNFDNHFQLKCVRIFINHHTFNSAENHTSNSFAVILKVFICLWRSSTCNSY